MTGPAREICHHKVNGLNEHLEVLACGEPGAGGANIDYTITWPGRNVPLHLPFQDGSIKEKGVNGLSNEALLAILIDRLTGFQRGPFPSDDNHEALQRLHEARLWLHKRTLDRVLRGVEGDTKR